MATTDENIGPTGTNDADSEASNRTFAGGGAAPTSQNPGTGDGSANMEFVLDIPLEVAVELGRTKMLINDLLKLGQGSVIELSKLAGESLDILANQKPIARGEVVVVNEKYGIRLTEVISPMERIERLR